MINVAMILLCVYCTVMIGQCRRGKTRIALAVCGVLTVGLAIGGSMGLCSAFGLFYSPLASVLPFLLLGLGVDDMFVIAISFDLTDSKLSIPERLGRSLAHSGASIAVTSTTDFLAFIIGATTILPALRMFCFYAAVGILLILLLQVFCFSAMLVIDEQYKARGACDPCCCICSSCCWMPTWCSFWVCNGSAQVSKPPSNTHNFTYKLENKHTFNTHFNPCNGPGGTIPCRCCGSPARNRDRGCISLRSASGDWQWRFILYPRP